jgi:hypothetical protein
VEHRKENKAVLIFFAGVAILLLGGALSEFFSSQIPLVVAVLVIAFLVVNNSAQSP